MESSSYLNPAIFSENLISAISRYEESHGLKAVNPFFATSSLNWTRTIEYVIEIANCTDLNLEIQQEGARQALHLISETNDIGPICYFGNVPFGHKAPPKAIIVKKYEPNLEEGIVPLMVYLSWKKECLPIKIIIRNEADVHEKKIIADSVLKGDFKSKSNKKNLIDHIYVYPQDIKRARAAASEDGLTCIFFMCGRRNMNRRFYVFDASEKKWTWLRWAKREGRMTGLTDIYYDEYNRELLTLGMSGWFYKRVRIKTIKLDEWPRWNIIVKD